MINANIPNKILAPMVTEKNIMLAKENPSFPETPYNTHEAIIMA
jgi:hypothetical protein